MESTQFLAEIEKITQEIFNNDEIVIAGHINPDGDSVGSCLALAMSIKKLGKSVKVLLESLPVRYEHIKGNDFIYDGDYSLLKPDLFIACDCASKERLGDALEVFRNARKTIVIDHHISNDYYGELNYVDSNASSASEMVYDVVSLIGNVDTDIASAIYAGIIFDTGGLRFDGTSGKTMATIASLLKHNIPFTQIYTQIMLNHTFEEAFVFSKVISKMQKHDNLPILHAYVSIDELAQVGGTPGDLEGVVEYMLNTAGFEVAVLVYEQSTGESKASLRSKDFDVNKVATAFGGGGHIKASGCSINLPPDEAMDKILKYIEGNWNGI